MNSRWNEALWGYDERWHLEFRVETFGRVRKGNVE